MDPLPLILTAALGYFIGGIPTAFVLARSRGIDIFEVGSGNMGATNVARALGGRYAVLTGVIDFVKGVVAVLIGEVLFPRDPYVGGVIGALAAIVGHSWSVYVLFLTGHLRGGKSAAVTGGTWLILAPLYISAAAVALFAVLLWRLRMVSLGVLAAVGLGGAWLLLWVALGELPPVMAVYAVVVFVLITYRHRSNIERLLQGTERRIGQTE
ncbi:MAG: glycerol-3-phosphate 1-O-acyltransferase PlsY [Anaerolineae bacterium]